MKPSEALETKRTEIRQLVAHFRAANPRVFGSVLYGTDSDGSDLDLLVDTLPGATLFDLGGLQDELEDLLASTRRSSEQISPTSFGGSQTRMIVNRLADYLDHIQQAAVDAC